jgi:hypothetical protein
MSDNWIFEGFVVWFQEGKGEKGGRRNEDKVEVGSATLLSPLRGGLFVRDVC